MANVVKVVLAAQDQIDQLNADCARLRALLGEAHAKLIVFPVLTRNPKLSSEAADLAALLKAERERRASACVVTGQVCAEEAMRTKQFAFRAAELACNQCADSIRSLE